MIGAVDIGGTKTLVAVFNDQGEIVEQQKFPTSKNYKAFREELASTVANLSTKDFSRAVVAMPGRVDRENGIGIRFGNLPWKMVHLQSNCETIFRTPVYIENDAKLAGLAEAIIIGDQYAKKVVYITISTGIGVALIINGKIDTDFGDSGGHAMIMEHDGRRVSWESFASGKAIVKRFGKQAREIEDAKTWKILSKDFAIGLIEVIALTEPEVVIIGGGVGSHFDKFGTFLREELQKYATPMMSIPPVIQAKHPEEAVIYGCYEYAKQHGV